VNLRFIFRSVRQIPKNLDDGASIVSYLKRNVSAAWPHKKILTSQCSLFVAGRHIQCCFIMGVVFFFLISGMTFPR